MQNTEDITSTDGYYDAMQRMVASDWGNLPFFRSPLCMEIASSLDEKVLGGEHILPGPKDVFNALELTPRSKVRAVILGQDPYPTPGDAHGLAFSIAQKDRRLPPSLKTIYQSLEADLGIPPAAHGNLSEWAKSGVLLLNASLTVTAGKANSHQKLGWSSLTNDILASLNNHETPIIFMLWGNFAHKAGALITNDRHCIIKTVHPSPLARGSGAAHKFVEAQPFKQAHEWCLRHGIEPIDWRLEP